MTEEVADVWTDASSVLFTSFWGWGPETWGAIGWTKDRGRTRRDNLLRELPDPFICVGYVTGNRTDTDPNLKGMIAGFYLVSHETGDRDEFTHPIHHDHGGEPEKWRHSLRAIRAFSYLPEYRRRAIDLFPNLSRTALSVAGWGRIITDPAEIDKLRSIPWIEVPVFSSPRNESEPHEPDHPISGMVKAGPASSGGYVVLEGTENLPRELYVLRLTGDIAAYLGRGTGDASIYKIGLSYSPELRRQSLQKSMPKGTFKWELARTTRKDGHAPYSRFSAAVAGEDAIKRHLVASNSEWLGGEFYLASDAQIAAAWHAGRQTALSVEQNGLSRGD